MRLTSSDCVGGQCNGDFDIGESSDNDEVNEALPNRKKRQAPTSLPDSLGEKRRGPDQEV